MDVQLNFPREGHRLGLHYVALMALLVTAIGTATASDVIAPATPPCPGLTADPPYAPTGAPPFVQTWSNGRLADKPALATCLGWTDLSFRTLVALAGTFQLSGGSTELLSRVGSVSSLRVVRYWSTTDSAWLPLVAASTPQTAEVGGQARADFTASELASGRDFYMLQRDNRSASDVIYRMRVRESSVDHLVIETQNVTAVRWWGMTLFKPGALRTAYFLDMRAPNTWSYYALTKIADGSWLVSGHEKSYINRVVALYRHLAGIPTDSEPPAAP